MTTPFDITGTQTQELRLPLPPETAQALRDAGVTPPEAVVLHLREASLRERQRFQSDQQGIAQQDTFGWLASLILRRAATGTDERVVRELVQDMTPTSLAMITHAYLQGVLPDPKVTAEAVQQTLTGMTTQLLGALASAGPSPSSATSTG